MRRYLLTLIAISISVGLWADDENSVLLSVAGSPAGATVTIDGGVRGVAPMELRLPAGRYRVLIEADRFESHVEELVLEGASEYRYALKRQVATIHLTSEPDGARVLIDGFDFGRTPTDARVYHGGHLIEYSRKEYKPHEKRVTVTGDGTIHLTFSTFVQPAFLSVSADPLFPEGEPVSVDGRPIGRTPIELSTVYGRQVEVSISGVTRSFTLEPGHHYLVEPRTRVEPAESRPVAIPAYRHVAPQPDLLPEFRVAYDAETILRLDAPSFIVGTVLSIVAGGAVGLTAAWQGFELAEAVLIAGGFAAVSQLISTVSSVEREVVAPYSKIPISRNVRRNARALGEWEALSHESVEHNRRLLESVNAGRGEWRIKHIGTVTEAAD